MHTKTTQVQIKTGPDDGLTEGEFIAYPATFTREPDSYGDVIVKGAFTDTIAEWKTSGKTMPGLFGHRMDDPDFFVASAKDMGEDDHGWWVKGMFDLDAAKGPQVYRLVKGGRISQLSFAYDVVDDATVKLDDGTKVNELRKVKVYEFSFVPVGANQDTSVVAVKEATDALIKSGRILSAKNESALRDVRDTIDSVLTSLESQAESTGKATPTGGAQSEASGHTDATPQEPAKATGQEPRVNPSARALELQSTLLTINGKG